MEKKLEEIKSVLEEHVKEISEKIYAPSLGGWYFWVSGKLGNKEIAISGYLTGGMAHNPANYQKSSWLVKFDVITDFLDLSQEEIEDLSEEEKLNCVEEILWDEIERLSEYDITWFDE